MANFAAALKAEIVRLARKEIRAHVTPLKSTVAQQRRDIATLKRRIQQIEKQLSFLQIQERKRIARPASNRELEEGVRYSVRTVQSMRRRLGLSAEGFAKLAGVSTQTIYHWEQGRSRPRKAQFAKLVALRGIGKREALERLKMLGVDVKRSRRRGKKRRKARAAKTAR